MKRLTALIIDDERLARIILLRELKMFPIIEVIGEATGVNSAVKCIKELNPDIIFLDIQLADGNGFDIFDKIEFKGKIIFVTAFNEYACRAFEINAQDYLLKPLSKERLKSVINRVISDDQEQSSTDYLKVRYDDRIMIEQKSNFHFIKVEDIVFIKANREYTTLFVNGGKEYLLLKSITDWQKRLPDEHFARIHRNSIINFNYIERSERIGNTAILFLRNIAESVSVSKRYYKTLKSRYFYK
jgi:two-component system LytT family response regulator